jgi:hypothetical protein
MSKYNTKTVPVVQPTTTLQGGSGFTQTPEKELVGLLSTGLSNTYYEKETDREKRFAEVFNKVASKNPTFAAKALVYARTVFGQRTVTHYGAVQIIKHLQGNPLGKSFFSKRDRNKKVGGIVYRLDDMHEILACYFAKNGENASIPNSIKKGFKDAIEAADAYQLAKYQMKGKAVSLVDIVNLVHPKETTANGTVDVSKEEYLKAVKGTKFETTGYLTKCSDQSDGIVRIPALHALIVGVLKQFNTVEDKNSEAGQEVAAKVKAGTITRAEAEKELATAKTENFSELIKSGKIGYLALLRNLRNIVTLNDTALLDDACRLLINADFIKKSLVLPHQIDLALEVMLTEFSGNAMAKIAVALNTAYEKSVPNLAEYFNEGRTAVVLDVSGSMSTKTMIEKSKYSNSSARTKGALIAATLAKGIAADTYVFADRCARVSYNPLDSVHTLAKALASGNYGVGGGTSWSTIFPVLANSGRYDRVFLISDEQGADSVERSYTSYVKQFGYPETYVINMCGYAPTMLKESTHVHRLFGYSPDVYEAAKRCELDYNAVINEINKIVI